MIKSSHTCNEPFPGGLHPDDGEHHGREAGDGHRGAGVEDPVEVDARAEHNQAERHHGHGHPNDAPVLEAKQEVHVLSTQVVLGQQRRKIKRRKFNMGSKY